MRTKPNPALVETAIPARLDRLRWGQFHTLVVVALGITWILDGLEVTLAGAVAGALKESPTLNLTNAEVGLASSSYLAGAVLGALLFGWLTDRLGRKRLCHGLLMGFPKLRAVPLSHRGRHWRRIHGHCLDHSGVR